MFSDDCSYYQHRISIESERAKEAKTLEAVLVHLQLAEAYRSKLKLIQSAKPTTVTEVTRSLRERSHFGCVVA